MSSKLLYPVPVGKYDSINRYVRIFSWMAFEISVEGNNIVIRDVSRMMAEKSLKQLLNYIGENSVFYEEKVKVAEKFKGKIIGTNGKTADQLMADTGANIEFPVGEEYVIIKGRKATIEDMKKKIQTIINACVPWSTEPSVISPPLSSPELSPNDVISPPSSSPELSPNDVISPPLSSPVISPNDVISPPSSSPVISPNDVISPPLSSPVISPNDVISPPLSSPVISPNDADVLSTSVELRKFKAFEFFVACKSCRLNLINKTPISKECAENVNHPCCICNDSFYYKIMKCATCQISVHAVCISMRYKTSSKLYQCPPCRGIVYESMFKFNINQPSTSMTNSIIHIIKQKQFTSKNVILMCDDNTFGYAAGILEINANYLFLLRYEMVQESYKLLLVSSINLLIYKLLLNPVAVVFDGSNKNLSIMKAIEYSEEKPFIFVGQHKIPCLIDPYHLSQTLHNLIDGGKTELKLGMYEDLNINVIVTGSFNYSKHAALKQCKIFDFNDSILPQCHNQRRIMEVLKYVFNTIFSDQPLLTLPFRQEHFDAVKEISDDWRKEYFCHALVCNMAAFNLLFATGLQIIPSNYSTLPIEALLYKWKKSTLKRIDEGVALFNLRERLNISNPHTRLWFETIKSITVSQK